MNNFDVAINKRFAIAERARLEFRRFGTFTGARAPRIVQFAMKLIY